MSKKNKEIDDLARELCWTGFHYPETQGCTKHQYWRKITERSRAAYREDIVNLLNTIRRLGIDRVNLALSSTMSDEQHS
jgi:hypothetical protein